MEAWLAARRREVLPVPYFHLVFTLPHELNALLAATPKPLYENLFSAVSATLAGFAASPRHLGGVPAFSLVLHTWKQADWQRLKQRLHTHDWVVYAKQPLGGPEAVLEYLGRYTHRVAISNERILGIDGNDVLLRVRADPTSGKKRTLRVPGTEFIDRFLQHVLPAGFKRIRHYGLLSPTRKRRLWRLLVRHSSRAATCARGGRVGRRVHAAGHVHRAGTLSALRDWSVPGGRHPSATT